MRIDEVRQLTDEELEHKLADLKEELFRLKFQAKSGKIEKPSRISETRRAIARILTVKREKKETGTKNGK
jgi:large subunit ribosomal protein L29